MKVLFTLVAATLTSLAVAQEAPKPQLRGSGPAPAPAAPASDAAPTTEAPAKLEIAPAAKSGEGISLIPETLEPAPKPKGGKEVTDPGQKIDRTTAAEDALKLRIKLREAKTKADRDPKVMAELDRSNRAKTDLEHREALTSYYKLLYGKAAKLDPSVAAKAAEECNTLTRRMAQTRIAPTEPLDPEDQRVNQQ